MKSFPERRAWLKARLRQPETLVVPGCHDALSAILAERAGFQAVYIGSYGAAAARGLPDVGLLTMDELVASVASVAQATDLPVIADAENGFYNAANIWRMVRAYETAGAAAIHIDDHASGKHSDWPRKTLPLDQAVQNIKAAVAARDNENFLIIGRTDIAWATGNPQDARERMIALHEAGADLVFPTGVSFAAFSAMRPAIPAKVVAVHTESASVADENVAGMDIVIYHTLGLYAAAAGVANAFGSFKASGDGAAVAKSAMGDCEFEQLLDYQGFNQRGKAYGLA